jgi:YD repeat-containing protein
VFYGLAPWPDQEQPVFRSAFPAVLVHRLVLFGNPVLVTHETHTRVRWEWIGFSRSILVTRKIG